MQLSLEALSDEEICEYMGCEGADAAFEEIYRRYEAFIRLAAHRYKGQLSAQEAEADGLYALYRAARGYKPAFGVPFGAFARMVIRRAVQKQAEKCSYRARKFLVCEIEDYTYGTDCEELRFLEEADSYRKLRSRLEKSLCPKQANAVLLCAEGYSPAEIANSLGISQGAAAQALRRGRMKMQALALPLL